MVKSPNSKMSMWKKVQIEIVLSLKSMQYERKEEYGTLIKQNLSCKQKLKMWASRSVVHCQTGPAYMLPANKR